MSTDLQPSLSCVTHKRVSFVTLLLGWMKARFGDVMLAAEVLHDIQWAAPWDDHPRSK